MIIKIPSTCSLYINLCLDKIQNLCYNDFAKQTKYYFFKRIFISRDIYTLFEHNVFIIDLQKMQIPT